MNPVTKHPAASRKSIAVAAFLVTLVLSLVVASQAQGFAGPFCGTSSNPVHLGSGNACIHGAGHSSYSWLYGQSAGTAYTRAGVSSSSSSVIDVVHNTCSSSGGCVAGFTGGGGATWPGGYAYLWNHSTFASDFYGSIGG